ncbi:hypothetical protein QJS66_20115 [Kocuria rhizophila]|nr:hypothetical protein QJS66_20115 [Kocuria rhizophila]
METWRRGLLRRRADVRGGLRAGEVPAAVELLKFQVLGPGQASSV